LGGIRRPLDSKRFTGERVWLRAPQAGDFEDWRDLRAASRAFLEPWEPTWPSDVLSRPSFRRRLKRYARDASDDNGFSYFIFRQSDDALVSGINLSHVHRGVSQSCSIGYWVGENFARQGLMSDAVKATVKFIFADLALHRVEAACVPSNIASRELLRKVGFQEEGYARKYLRINGAWEDHLLFAYLATDGFPAAK
jgi:ribosomal-protein-alanine N-acetyltransferase